MWPPQALRIKDGKAAQYKLRGRITAQDAGGLLAERLQPKLKQSPFSQADGMQKLI